MGKMRDVTPNFRKDTLALCRSLFRDLFDLYRPERHYMRGPGPKWHEKHALQPSFGGTIDRALSVKSAH
jgi:hypothetical protein